MLRSWLARDSYGRHAPREIAAAKLAVIVQPPAIHHLARREAAGVLGTSADRGEHEAAGHGRGRRRARRGTCGRRAILRWLAAQLPVGVPTPAVCRASSREAAGMGRPGAQRRKTE